MMWQKIKSTLESMFESISTAPGPTSLGVASNVEYDWSGRIRFVSTLDDNVWLNKSDLIDLLEAGKGRFSKDIQYLVNRIKGIGPKDEN